MTKNDSPIEKKFIPGDWVYPTGEYKLYFFCAPDSLQWDSAIRNMFHIFARTRRWDGDKEAALAVSAIAREIEVSLMSCDLDEIVDRLDRIAVALEGIDSKTASIITWQDLIDDLQDAFGIGSLIHRIVDGIFGLMPRIRAKMDFTPLVMGMWTYMTWTAPILANLVAITASLAAIAAAQATGRILDIINTIMNGLGLLQTTGLGWKDLIFGDKSVWGDIVQPLWAWFIGDEGEDPDIDPSLRIQTRIIIQEEAMSVIVNNTVNCGSCGGSGCSNCSGPTDIPEYGQPDPEGPPPNGFEDWETYSIYKCKAANVLAANLLSFLAEMNALRLYDYSSYTVFDRLSSFIAEQLNSASEAIGDILTSAAAFIGEQSGLMVYPASELPSSNLGIYGNLILLVVTDRTDVVCDLFGAVDTGEARTLLTDRLQSYVDGLEDYDQAIKDRAMASIGALLSNQWLNRLWQLDSTIDGYEDVSAVDCAYCGFGNLVIYRTWGTLTPQGGDSFTFLSVLGVYNFQRFACGMDNNGCFEVLDFNLNNYTPTSLQAISLWYYGDETYTVLDGGATAAEIIAAIEGYQFVDIDLATDQNVGQPFSGSITISPC